MWWRTLTILHQYRNIPTIHWNHQIETYKSWPNTASKNQWPQSKMRTSFSSRFSKISVTKSIENITKSDFSILGWVFTWNVIMNVKNRAIWRIRNTVIVSPNIAKENSAKTTIQIQTSVKINLKMLAAFDFRATPFSPRLAVDESGRTESSYFVWRNVNQNVTVKRVFSRSGKHG